MAETKAEPTEGEAEPESTSSRETKAEPTEAKAEPESTSRREAKAQPTGLGLSRGFFDLHT